MALNSELKDCRGMITISFSVHRDDKKFVLKQPNKNDITLDNENQLNAAVITLIAPYLRVDNLTTSPDPNGYCFNIADGKLAYTLNVFKDVY